MAAIQRTTKQQIFDAVQDLHNREQMVTREVLQMVTGIKLTIIDDRLATMVDDGLLIRKSRGVFVPAVQHPPARDIQAVIDEYRRDHPEEYRDDEAERLRGMIDTYVSELVDARQQLARYKEREAVQGWAPL